MLYSEKTLRKKAAAAGYRIEKGFQHYHNGGVYRLRGERITGYNVVDDLTGLLVYDCFNQEIDHLWSLSDVQEFLQTVYDDNGLTF